MDSLENFRITPDPINAVPHARFSMATGSDARDSETFLPALVSKCRRSS